MGTATLTLTDFLLARIEEDEERARPMWDERVKRRHLGLPVSVQWPTPDRILAECEAKRRIVGFRGAIGIPEGHAIPAGEGFTWLDGAHTAVAAERDRILRILAASYADHPDFRDEWRP